MVLLGIQAVGDAVDAAVLAAKYLKSGASHTHPLLSAESVLALKNKTIQLDLISLDPLTTKRAIALPTKFIFRNTPDELSISSPSRTGVTQTKGGVWIEDFGMGVRELSMQGTTGYKKVMVGKGKNRIEKDGRQSIRDLQDLYINYNLLRQDQAVAGEDFRGIVMVFHMFSEKFHYVVHPMNFTLKRSKSNPLLYFYAMSFIILGAYVDFNTTSSDSVMNALNTPEARFNQIVQNLKDYAEDVYKECVNFTQFPAINELSTALSWTNAAASAVADFYLGLTKNATEPDFFFDRIFNEKSYAWVTDLSNYCSAGIDTGLVIGTSAYDLVHSIRQLEACLKTAAKLTLTKPIEDDWKKIKNTFADSGCATTLRL